MDRMLLGLGRSLCIINELLLLEVLWLETRYRQDGMGGWGVAGQGVRIDCFQPSKVRNLKSKLDMNNKLVIRI